MSTRDSVLVCRTQPNEGLLREWEVFLSKAGPVTMFQRPEMFEVFARSPGFEPVAVFARGEDGQLVGSVVAVIQREAVAWYGRLMARCVVRGGPVAAAEQVAERLVREVEDWAKGRALYTVISSSQPLAGLEVIGYRAEPHLNYLFDLERGVGALWETMSGTRRKQVRRGERRGLEIRDEDPVGFNLEAHYDVLRATYRRARLPLFHRGHFAAARDVLGPQGHLLVLGAYRQGELVANRLLLRGGDTVFDWFAGSLPSSHDLYPNEALVWRALVRSTERGARRFDFGGAGHPDRPYGVREFKRKFGGREVRCLNYRRSANALLDWAVRSARAFAVAVTGGRG